MALTKWHKRGQQIRKPLTRCPNPGAKTKQMSLFTKIIVGIFSLVCLSMFMCQCGTDSTPSAPSAQKAKEPAQTTSLTPEQQAEEQRRRTQEAEQKKEQEVEEQKRRVQEEDAKQEQEALALGLRWQYDESSEKMGRGTVKTAIVRSLNEVQFGFPYSGEQRGTLLLRVHPKHGKDVILGVEKGQFLCGIYNCNVAVRFDNGKVQNFTAVGPADHSTTMLFLRGYDRFIAGARKAKKVYIEAQFFQQGTRVFEFDISGLKW
jgi:hypothetical protein